MKLKCIRTKGPFIEHEVYDVAFIYEFPVGAGLVMAREPSGDWPAPDSDYFAWEIHNLFETPAKPIEIIQCGYRWKHVEYYGTEIPIEGIAKKTIKKMEKAYFNLRDRYAPPVARNFPGIEFYESSIIDNRRQSVAIVGIYMDSLCGLGSFDIANELLAAILNEMQIDPTQHEFRHLEREIWTQHETIYAAH